MRPITPASPLCHCCHTAGGRSYHRIGRKEFELVHEIDFDIIVEGLFTEWSALRCRDDAKGRSLER